MYQKFTWENSQEELGVCGTWDIEGRESNRGCMNEQSETLLWMTWVDPTVNPLRTCGTYHRLTPLEEPESLGCISQNCIPIVRYPWSNTQSKLYLLQWNKFQGERILSGREEERCRHLWYYVVSMHAGQSTTPTGIFKRADESWLRVTIAAINKFKHAHLTFPNLVFYNTFTRY